MTCSFQKRQRQGDPTTQSAVSHVKTARTNSFEISDFCIHEHPGFGATNCLCFEPKPKVIDTKRFLLMPPIDCRIKRNRPLMQDNSSPRIIKKLEFCPVNAATLASNYSKNKKRNQILPCQWHVGMNWLLPIEFTSRRNGLQGWVNPSAKNFTV